MKHFVILFVILVLAAMAGKASAQHRVNPSTQLEPRTGGPGGNKYYGWRESLEPGNLANSVFGDGADRNITYPERAYAHVVYYGWASNPTTGLNFTPLTMHGSVPVGSGLTSRSGVFQDVFGEWLPVDTVSGAPFDPVTLEDLEGRYAETIDLENPFDDRAYEFEVVLYDPETGLEIGSQIVTVPPGGTIPFTMAADRPFNWAVYDRVEGVRGGTAASSGSGSYGGSNNVPAPGPPQTHSGTPYTPPRTPPAPAPADDIQAEIERLAQIVQQSQDDARQDAGLAFDQFEKLNQKAEAMKDDLGELAEGVGVSNTLLGEIRDNTAGGAGGALTQEQLEETLDREGTPHGIVDTTEADMSEGEGIAGDIGDSVGDLRDAFGGLFDALGEGVEALGLDQSYAQTDWTYTLPLGMFGEYEVNVESWGWILDLMRAVFLSLLSFHFFGVYIRQVRNSFA